jgi:hypothetical protein
MTWPEKRILVNDECGVLSYRNRTTQNFKTVAIIRNSVTTGKPRHGWLTLSPTLH